MKTIILAATASVAGFIAICAAAAPPPHAVNNPASDEFAVRVVSSAPHQVTGGEARLHIEVPRTVPLHQVEV